MPYKDYEKQKARARQHYYEVRDKRIIQAKAYYEANKEKRRAQIRAWGERNPEKLRALRIKYHKKFIANNPEKKAAWGKTHWAIYSGRLVKPNSCESCKRKMEKRQIHAHHHLGYTGDHIYQVQWLCGSCHRKTHWRIHSQEK